jgi:hypothetical protein
MLRDPFAHASFTFCHLTLNFIQFLGGLLQSRSALAAENLFLRKQLVLCQERQVRPRRATDAIRLTMAYGPEIEAMRRRFRECWIRDGFPQILGRVCLHQTECRGGGRSWQSVGLHYAGLISASSRRQPQQLIRISSWESSRESGSAAVVIPHYAAESLTARDVTGCAAHLGAWFDDPVVEPLMVSFRVIMGNELLNGVTQRSVTEENHAVKSFFFCGSNGTFEMCDRFGDRGGRRTQRGPTCSTMLRNASQCLESRSMSR